jgi:hypothetical protein
MKKFESHWKDFQEIWYMSIFGKSANRTEVSVKSDRNNGYVTRRTTCDIIVPFGIILRMINVSDIICKENKNTYFMFNNSST